MPSEQLRERLRAHLRTLERDLEQQVASMREDLRLPLSESVGELASYDQHTSDLGEEVFERSKDMGIVERLLLTLDEVRAALERMDHGEYGRCEECGKPIEDERLAALPYARRCAACQRVHDEDERQRVDAGARSRRPIEELTLVPPFARGDVVGAGESGIGPDDVWQALAQYGNANSPQDVPGAVDYDETYEGADTQSPGGTSEIEFVADVKGTGVADPDAVYPDPSGPGRRRDEPDGEDREG